jgi:hypothetical protein
MMWIGMRKSHEESIPPLEQLDVREELLDPLSRVRRLKGPACETRLHGPAQMYIPTLLLSRINFKLESSHVVIRPFCRFFTLSENSRARAVLSEHNNYMGASL